MTNLKYCDLCGASEIEDILGNCATFPLRAIEQDAEGVWVCEMCQSRERFLAELNVMMWRAKELCPDMAVGLAVLLAAHYAGAEERFARVCVEFGAELADEINEQRGDR